MKTFAVGWGVADTLPDGQPRVPVQTTEELDRLLESLESERSAGGTPIIVEIAEEGDGDDFITYHLSLGLGHLNRSVLYFAGAPAGGSGFDPDLPPWTDGSVLFDYGAGCNFEDVTFFGHALFDDAIFSGGVLFSRATFTEEAWFPRATFAQSPIVEEERYPPLPAWFRGVTFSRDALFTEAKFLADATFDDATFRGHALFDGAKFGGGVDFGGVDSRHQIEMDGAQAMNLGTEVPRVWPPGWVVQVDPDEPDRGVLVREQGAASASD